MSSSPGRTLVEAQLADDAQLPGAVNYVTAFVSGAPADQLDAFIDGDPAGSWPLSCDGECSELPSTEVDSTTVGLGDQTLTLEVRRLHPFDAASPLQHLIESVSGSGQVTLSWEPSVSDAVIGTRSPAPAPYVAVARRAGRRDRNSSIRHPSVFDHRTSFRYVVVHGERVCARSRALQRLPCEITSFEDLCDRTRAAATPRNWGRRLGHTLSLTARRLRRLARAGVVTRPVRHLFLAPSSVCAP
jgi:hypothetical protein